MPDTVLIRVVLPAPFGPTSATISPRPTRRDTPSSAVAAPYRTTRSRTSSAGPVTMVARLSANPQPSIGRPLWAVSRDTEDRQLGSGQPPLAGATLPAARWSPSGGGT